MTAHDNISVPNESWPNWTWYAIEFALVFVASMVIAWQISDIILYNVAASLGHGNVLESCSLLEYFSTRRINFRDSTRPFGKYAMCILPKNGNI